MDVAGSFSCGAFDSTLANLTLALRLDRWSVAEHGVNAPSPRKSRGWQIRCFY